MSQQGGKDLRKKHRSSHQNHSVENTSLQSKKHEDSNNFGLTRDVNQVCANCCSSIDSSTSKIHDTSLNSSQNQSSAYSNNSGVNDSLNNSRDDVNKMLLAIYNLDFIPRLFQKYPDALPEGDIQLIVNLPLCFLCTNLLKPLFSLYSQFNQLRKMNSLLSQQVNSLNYLINYDDQKQNHRLNDNDHTSTKTTTTTTSNSSSSRKRRAEFPSNDRGPWVKLGPKLEELTVEDIGYAPPSLRHLYQDEVNQGASNRGRRQETDNQKKVEPRTRTSCHSNTTKLEFSADDQSSWVKVGSRLEDQTVEEEEEEEEEEPDRASLILPNQGQEAPESKLTLSELFSLALDQDADEDDDYSDDDFSVDENRFNISDMDFEPPFSLNSDSDDDNDRVSFVNSQSPLVPNPSLSNIQKDEDVIPVSADMEPGGTTKEQEEEGGENETFKCSECPIVFHSKSAWVSHINKKHSEKGRKAKTKKFSCTAVIKETGQVCPFQTKYSGNLKKHVLNMHPEKKGQFKCSECPKAFNNKGSLRNHFNVKHSENGTLRCTAVDETGQICSYRGPKSNLKIHMLTVHAEEKDKVQCSECSKEFKSESGLKYHFRYMHRNTAVLSSHNQQPTATKEQEEKDGENETFKCSECPKVFYIRSSWRDHFRRKHTEKGRKADANKFSCTAVIKETGQVCPYQTNLMGSLKKHMLSVHAEEKDKVKCGECHKVFKSKINLGVHVRKMHCTGKPRLLVKPRQCNAVDETGQICSYRGAPSAVKAHMLGVHAEEKDKVQCGECYKEFKSELRAKDHIQRIHKKDVYIIKRAELEKLLRQQNKTVA